MASRDILDFRLGFFSGVFFAAVFSLIIWLVMNWPETPNPNLESPFLTDSINGSALSELGATEFYISQSCSGGVEVGGQSMSDPARLIADNFVIKINDKSYCYKFIGYYPLSSNIVAGFFDQSKKAWVVSIAEEVGSVNPEQFATALNWCITDTTNAIRRYENNRNLLLGKGGSGLLDDAEDE